MNILPQFLAEGTYIIPRLLWRIYIPVGLVWENENELAPSQPDKTSLTGFIGMASVNWKFFVKCSASLHPQIAWVWPTFWFEWSAWAALWRDCGTKFPLFLWLFFFLFSFLLEGFMLQFLNLTRVYSHKK